MKYEIKVKEKMKQNMYRTYILRTVKHKGNQRIPKYVKGYTMFICWKTQHSENVSFP